jgi:hypothetical protein
MKPILSLLLITALIATSCTKKGDNGIVIPDVLTKAISSQYIHGGTDVNIYRIEFSTYKPGEDCDKAVFNAALEAVQGGSGIDKVTVVGTNITMDFVKGSSVQPAKISLTSGSALDLAVNKDWKWKGRLVISKQNSFLSEDDFMKAVNIDVSGVNTGDVAQVTDKFVAGDSMYIEYALTSFNPEHSLTVFYDMQANTPVTLKSQFKIDCLIPGFIYPQSIVAIDISTRLTAPKQKDLGNGVTSYSQRVFDSWVTQSLSEYIAVRYFSEKFYPTVK